MTDDLNIEIARVLAIHTAIICERVKARWKNMSAIKGLEEIHSDLPVIVGDLVTGTINASGDAAWIKEFGSGSKLDVTSPYFEAYKRTDRWNKEREYEGNEFIGRKQGDTVYRPDGTTYISSGKANRRVYKMNKASYRSDGQTGQYGLHLERPLNWSGKNPGFKAFAPTHVIRNEILKEKPEIDRAMQKVMNDYALQQLSMAFNIYV